MNTSYLHEMDHYDAYTYLIFGPIAFMCALCFIALNFVFKEARRFPNSLLLIITIGDLGLCVHWFFTGLYTKFILGTEEIHPRSWFCRANSLSAAVFASVGFYYHLSFFIAIILMVKSAMKELKGRWIFHVAPLVPIVMNLIYVNEKNALGKNIYGSCSVVKIGNAGGLYIAANALFILVGFYTIWTLQKFMRMGRQKVTLKDDFYKFYVNYTALISFLYLTIGANLFFSNRFLHSIPDCHGKEDCDQNVHMKYFFLSRIGNTLKIFMPIFAFLLRISDPFLRKLAHRMFKTKYRPPEEDMEINDGDDSRSTMVQSIQPEPDMEEKDLLNSKIQAVRRGMVRTILLGLSEYYCGLIENYCSQEPELANNLTHKVGGYARASVRKSLPEFVEAFDIENGGRFYDCGMLSTGAREFKQIIQSRAFKKIEESFNVKDNAEAVRKSGGSDGGAGGEFFLLSHDRRFFVKTITEDEETIFRDILKDYTEYFAKNPTSFITRIIGLFSFSFKFTNQPIRLIVMENVFEHSGSMIDRRYDLKGSSYHRQTIKKIELDTLEMKHVRFAQTLKDLDFNRIERNIVLDKQTREMVVGNIEKDSAFFKKCKIIDYSLLLGVIDVENLTKVQMDFVKTWVGQKRAFFDVEKKLAIMIGVIDYFQLYTFSKLFEKYWKKMIKIDWRLETSSQPSTYYSDRFASYMNKIFPENKRAN